MPAGRPQKQSELPYLSVVQGAAMTFDEIAQELGLTRSNVYSAFNSGMRKLRRCQDQLTDLKALSDELDRHRSDNQIIPGGE